MTQILRLLGLAGLITLAALLACDSSPSSPTSTSPPQGASSSRISGSFVSGTSGAARLTAHPLSTFDSITVHVKQNAGLRVEVSSNGTFTLDGVPTGTVVLVFTRDGENLGEVTIRGVTVGDEVRVMLELTADDTVVLVEVRRASDEDTSDDTSQDTELELELDPDKWCPEWANGGRPEDDPVFATIKGESIGDVDLGSIVMVGPSGQVSPMSAQLKGDRIEVIFDNADVIKIVSGIAEGQRATVRITGKFKDGTSWELTESIRVKCDDDDSDDNSSG